MPSDNPEVNKRARDKWYRENKAKQLARQSERRLELVQWFWEYKASLSCTDCQKSFAECPEQCDFHHLDPSIKSDQVHKFARSGKVAMLRELEKCVPLCANCHRTRHKDTFRYYQDFSTAGKLE